MACRVCEVEHSPELHEAVLSVRAWFRRQVAPVPIAAPEIVKRDKGQGSAGIGRKPEKAKEQTES